MLALGIDIGGTFIKYALVEKNMQIVKQWKKETKQCTTKDEFYDYLCQDIDTTEIAFVGISAPGVITEDSTIISHAAKRVQIMYQTNVNKEVQTRLQLPVHTINDAKGAGYCELQIGNGKETKSSAYFIIGTGIGGCLCNEHDVIQGVDGVAGEFSNIPIGYKEDSYKLRGLHHIASMSALINNYNKEAIEPKRYGTEIAELYLQGDEVATKVVDQWCKDIVLGLYTIVMMYNPEVICIGGGISKADWFMEKVTDLFTNKVVCMAEPPIHTQIKRCKYDNSANLLGAILYAKEKMDNT